MTLERYLCVGGVEVANPCRTAAYLTRLGNPCLPNPPSKNDCGCCDEWLPEATDQGIVWTDNEYLYSVCTKAGGASQTTTANDLPPGAAWQTPVADPDEWEAALFATAPTCSQQWSGAFVWTIDGDPAEGTYGILGSGGTNLSGSAVAGTFSALPSGTHTLVCEFTNNVAGIVWARTTWEIDADAGTITLLSAERTATAGPGPGSTEASLPITDNYALEDGQTILLGRALEGFWTIEVTDNGDGTVDLLIGLGLQRSAADCGACGPGPEYEFTLYPPIENAYNDNDGLGQLIGLTPDDQGSGSLPFTATLDKPASGETTYLFVGANDSEVTGTSPAMVLVAIAGDPVAPDYGNVAFSLNSFWHGKFDGPVVIGDPYTLRFGGAALQVATLTSTPGEFTTPAADDAPWYDPAVPESADVLGVWLEEVRLSVPWKRDATDALRGAALGPGRFGGRELQLAGWVYTRSAAATAYARNWLFEVLAGAGCEDGCDLPDAQVALYCDPERPDAGARTLKRVGLTAFDPEIEPEFPRACGLKFEATLTAEVPELFLEPERVADVELAIDLEATVCTICSPCPEPTASPCRCGGLADPVRVVPQPDPASLYCLPSEVSRFAVQLPAPHYWRDATAIVRVEAGTWPGEPARPGLANLRIRGWQNPAGLADPALFDCQEPCLDVEVGCIPAGSALVIDGTTRTATLECGLEELNGYAYLSSAGGRRFSWPDVSCYGLLLVVEADPYNTAPGGQVAIDFVLRERG